MKCKKFSSAFNAYVVQKLKKLKVKHTMDNIFLLYFLLQFFALYHQI